MSLGDLSKLEHVIVTTDLSEASNTALSFVDGWFQELGINPSITLLCVVESSESGTVSEPLDLDSSRYVDVKSALEKMVLACTHVQRIEPTIINASGAVAESIASFAAAESAELIVIASHGRSGFARFVLGSVTERLLSCAACPVLVVPAGQSGARSPGPLRMLVTTDFSESSTNAFPIARAIYDRYGSARAQLTIIHAAEDLTRETFGTSLGGDSESIRSDAETQASASLDVIRQEYFPDRLVMSTVVRSNDPAHEELTRYIAAHDVDIVIVAAQGRSALSQFFLGSMTKRLIQSIRRILLIVPNTK